MEFKIRFASKKDFKLLAMNRWEYLSPEFPINKKFIKNYSNYLKNEFKLKRLYIVVAEINKEIIGNAYLIIIPKTPKLNSDFKSIGYITNVYIKEKYRNKKIGTNIIEEIIKFGKKEKVELMIVWPSTESREFYKRLSFKSENEVFELNFEE